MDDMLKTLSISAAGMRAQGTRLRIVAENLANADSLPKAAGAEPYRRQVVTFRQVLDRDHQATAVAVGRISRDPSPFGRRLEAGHPAADAQGYVATPNVNTLFELTDLREAQRSYEANLSVTKTSRSMLFDTIDILR